MNINTKFQIDDVVFYIKDGKNGQDRSQSYIGTAKITSIKIGIAPAREYSSLSQASTIVNRITINYVFSNGDTCSEPQVFTTVEEATQEVLRLSPIPVK